jgi:hypothetical protein
MVPHECASVQIEGREASLWPERRFFPLLFLSVYYRCHNNDALKLVAKVVFCEAFQSSRRNYRGTSIFKTVSKPLAHLNFLSGVNCYDIGSSISILGFSISVNFRKYLHKSYDPSSDGSVEEIIVPNPAVESDVERDKI